MAANKAADILGTILKRLIEYIKKLNQLKRKVKSVLAYPATIIFVTLVVLVFLLIFVILVFQEVFSNIIAAFLALTQAIVNLSDLLIYNAFWNFIGMITFAFIIVKSVKVELGKKNVAILSLKLPAFSDLLCKMTMWSNLAVPSQPCYRPAYPSSQV
jgi:type IV pilus assembly protein PilC